MTLTDKQNKGLKIAISRYKNKEKYTCISGFAGTGKSTLVQYIIKELNIPEKYIAYVAYTGRAALVLKNKGCPGQRLLTSCYIIQLNYQTEVLNTHPN